MQNIEQNVCNIHLSHKCSLQSMTCMCVKTRLSEILKPFFFAEFKLLQLTMQLHNILGHTCLASSAILHHVVQLCDTRRIDQAARQCGCRSLLL